jgi:hypothetical protein
LHRRAPRGRLFGSIGPRGRLVATPAPKNHGQVPDQVRRTHPRSPPRAQDRHGLRQVPARQASQALSAASGGTPAKGPPLKARSGPHRSTLHGATGPRGVARVRAHGRVSAGAAESVCQERALRGGRYGGAARERWGASGLGAGAPEHLGLGSPGGENPCEARWIVLAAPFRIADNPISHSPLGAVPSASFTLGAST